MLIRIITIISLIFATVPAFTLFGHLLTQYQVHNDVTFVAVETQGKWILVNKETTINKIQNVDSCYIAESSPHINQALKAYDSWRETHSGASSKFGLLLVMLSYLAFRSYGGFLEQLVTKKGKNKLKWLALRLVIILLSDCLVFKLLHSYRVQGFVDVTQCLGTVQGSDFMIEFIPDEDNRAKLVSQSGHWVLRFLNYENWELYQTQFLGVCILCAIISAIAFTKKEDLQLFLGIVGFVVLSILGLFGFIFDIALITLEKGAYHTLMGQINTLMLWRMLIAIIEAVIQFLFSPNFDYQSIPNEFRVTQEKSELDVLPSDGTRSPGFA